MRLIAFSVLTALSGLAQSPVTIRVNAAESLGPFKPIYGYFGYDEPNYTYTETGHEAGWGIGGRGRPTRLHPHALHAGHRRRHAGLEVRLD